MGPDRLDRISTAVYLGRTGNGTWISTVKTPNGRTMDLPVATEKNDEGYKPFNGVTWVFPATKANPQETFKDREA